MGSCWLFFFIDARAALRHATKWISRTKRDSVFFKSKEGGRGERSGNCRARSVVALYGSRRLYIILISASRSSTRPGFLSSPQSACAPLHYSRTLVHLLLMNSSSWWNPLFKLSPHMRVSSISNNEEIKFDSGNESSRKTPAVRRSLLIGQATARSSGYYANVVNGCAPSSSSPPLRGR